jgi:hypothetical protein
LFEVQQISGNAMASQPQGLLEKFGIIHHVLVFVKYESINLGSMAMALRFIIDCKTLKIL